MTAYGTYFFEMAHVGDAFMNSCILTAVGVVAIIIDLFIIAPFGRRRVFLTTGLIICGFCQLIVAVVYDVQPGTMATGRVVVAMSVIYIFVYNVSASFPFKHHWPLLTETRVQFVPSPGYQAVSSHLNVFGHTRLVSLLPLGFLEL